MSGYCLEDRESEINFSYLRKVAQGYVAVATTGSSFRAFSSMNVYQLLTINGYYKLFMVDLVLRW